MDAKVRGYFICIKNRANKVEDGIVLRHESGEIIFPVREITGKQLVLLYILEPKSHST